MNNNYNQNISSFQSLYCCAVTAVGFWLT